MAQVGNYYVVEGGDSYERIAGKVYGDQRMFQMLMEENGGVYLKPGMKILLPAKVDNPFVSNEKAAEFGMATNTQYRMGYDAKTNRFNWANTGSTPEMNRAWAYQNFLGKAEGLQNGMLPSGFTGLTGAINQQRTTQALRNGAPTIAEGHFLGLPIAGRTQQFINLPPKFAEGHTLGQPTGKSAQGTVYRSTYPGKTITTPQEKGGAPYQQTGARFGNLATVTTTPTTGPARSGKGFQGRGPTTGTTIKWDFSGLGKWLSGGVEGGEWKAGSGAEKSPTVPATSQASTGVPHNTLVILGIDKAAEQKAVQLQNVANGTSTDFPTFSDMEIQSLAQSSQTGNTPLTINTIKDNLKAVGYVEDAYGNMVRGVQDQYGNTVLPGLESIGSTTVSQYTEAPTDWWGGMWGLRNNHFDPYYGYQEPTSYTGRDTGGVSFEPVVNSTQVANGYLNIGMATG